MTKIGVGGGRGREEIQGRKGEKNILSTLMFLNRYPVKLSQTAKENKRVRHVHQMMKYKY